jgi:hypothetical protein
LETEGLDGQTMDLSEQQNTVAWNYRNFICSDIFDEKIVGSPMADRFDHIVFEIIPCRGQCASSSTA